MFSLCKGMKMEKGREGERSNVRECEMNDAASDLANTAIETPELKLHSVCLLCQPG
jgi:hypothetical protein